MKKYKQDMYDILHQAQLEKEKLNAPYMDTSHLMLAMLKKHQGIKKYFEENYQITYDKYLKELMKVIGKGKINELPGNLYTPLTKKVLFADDVDEYDIDTLHVLHNILEIEDGTGFRLLTILNLNNNDIDKIISDIECDNIGGYYELQEINLNQDIHMEYAYDLIASKKNGKGLYHFRKIPVILVEDKTLDILTSHIVSFDATSSLFLHLRASLFSNNNQTQSTNAVIIMNSHMQQAYILMLDYNKGTLTSKYISTILGEDIENLLNIYGSRKCTNINEDNILSISDEGIAIIDIEQIYIDYLEQQKQKEVQEANKIQNRQSSNLFKKISCLSNVNERVEKHQTEIIGMEDELEQLIKGLMGIRKPNVMLKGEPGVGKTALVERLAGMINKGQVPDILKDKVIYELSMGSAVAGTKYRGEFEEKLNLIIKEVEANPNIILFVDEAHTLVGAGGAEGAIDASNILKPALARGDIKMIGATTNEEYDKYIKPDGALSRRFSTIEILEPLENQVKDIMKGIIPKFEKHFQVTITDKIIDELYNKAKMKKGMFPDVALDTLEEWCIQQSYSDYEDNSNKPSEENLDKPIKEVKRTRKTKKVEVK